MIDKPESTPAPALSFTSAASMSSEFVARIAAEDFYMQVCKRFSEGNGPFGHVDCRALANSLRTCLGEEKGAGDTMRLFGSDGAGVVTITEDAIAFEGGAVAAQEAVCLGAAPTGGGRRLLSEAERRQLSFAGSLMTSGSFTMMASTGA